MKIMKSKLGLGSNLKRLRMDKGFSQSQLVLKLQLQGYNISYDIYKKIEQDKYNIPIALIVMLKYLYNITYDDFFTGISVDDVNGSE